jgi:NodT family efflux transporter outer membrane factor (OMF) lipoprotein
VKILWKRRLIKNEKTTSKKSLRKLPEKINHKQHHTMNVRSFILYILILWVCLPVGCKVPDIVIRNENRQVPNVYRNGGTTDTTNTARLPWRDFFADTTLVALIDTALKNNQELNIILMEIQVAKNEVKSKKGEYLPFGGVGLAGGVDKVGQYTRDGAVEENLNVQPGQPFPNPLGNIQVGAFFSWELDIWKKLRNAKNAALSRYLASVEGKNFMVTHLVAEIASTYYELLSLDNMLAIVLQNIQNQQNALNIVKQQKDAALVSQLAVNRFEAQLLNTQALQFDINQKIVETENHLNFLVGRFPQPIPRNALLFNQVQLDSIYAGVPLQLLENRTDIRQAEHKLSAAKLDVKVARASFYPTIRLSASIGFEAFNPAVWFNPQSLFYSIFGGLMAPLINRNEIVANYRSSYAKQLGAVYNYERTVLNAYIEVDNQLSATRNYTSSYNLKTKEVDILTTSVDISINLFNSARADYMEVLLTQREALKSRMELIEIKLKQLNSKVFLYKALGGGWQ